MAATSGIQISSQLANAFTHVVGDKSIRFVKISIRDESIVHDISIPAKGSLIQDLQLIQSDDLLQDNTPAYLLTRLDEPSAEWLAIFYVPDSAPVRDKMLYASSRASLIKSLGSTLFTDSIFATSKADLTPEAYGAHLRHLAAPKPLSAREQELADLRAAESSSATYDGTRSRISHIDTAVGFIWAPEAEEAVIALGRGEGSGLVVLKIDPQNETIILDSVSDASISTLSSALPSSDPAFGIFAWPHSYSVTPKREIVFIYCCPSSSPVKYRMLYSSGSLSTYRSVKSMLETTLPTVHVASRRVETSDPSDLDETYMKTELGLDRVDVATEDSHELKSFSKPKGPPRRR
ncbi:hypothetical protein BDQ17DRAFT_1357648 [Cyathus striatus]|nr:hypothetical protein BDQ17DRAFT_1357648 [Cyathus striatus]